MQAILAQLDDLQNQAIGGYRINTLISKNNGALYHTSNPNIIDPLTGNPKKFVAKIIPISDLNEQNVKNETDILSCLSHPNIIKLEDYKIINYLGYKLMVLFMPEAQEDLFKIMMERNEIGMGPLSENACRIIAYQILLALEHVHQQGIIHRDIKPENILVFCNSEESPRVVLADFGSAIVTPQYAIGEAGTTIYMAPEMLCGQQYTNKVDLWSFGILLYMLLSHSHPFSTVEEVTSDEIELNFPNEDWYNISEEAKNLVSKLICPCEQRLTAEEALRDEWFSFVHADPQAPQQLIIPMNIDYNNPVNEFE